ncbi:hypothetical protein Scep_008181 [Stephania cephalantha]|uniref:Uncharacterized protein n=1 Tax=Stephania cephalantha TaxID=152367 RepID=A0AAP0PNW7_9MAGN
MSSPSSSTTPDLTRSHQISRLSPPEPQRNRDPSTTAASDVTANAAATEGDAAPAADVGEGAGASAA